MQLGNQHVVFVGDQQEVRSSPRDRDAFPCAEGTTVLSVTPKYLHNAVFGIAGLPSTARLYLSGEFLARREGAFADTLTRAGDPPS